MNLVHLSWALCWRARFIFQKFFCDKIYCISCRFFSARRAMKGKGFKKNWHCFTTIGGQKKKLLYNKSTCWSRSATIKSQSIKFIHSQPPVSMSIMYFYHIQGDTVGGYLHIPQQGFATTLLSPFRCHTRHVYTSILASRCPV